MPASCSFDAANFRFSASVRRATCGSTPSGRDPGKAIDLSATKGLCVIDGLADAVLKFGDAIRMAGDAALSCFPVSGGQVEQDLGQAVLVETLGDIVLLERIREEILNSPEAGFGRRRKAVRKRRLREEHREIGVKFRHSIFSRAAAVAFTSGMCSPASPIEGRAPPPDRPCSPSRSQGSGWDRDKGFPRTR